MADKPKTYPQQVQELKQIITDKDAVIATLQNDIASIPTLTATIADLQSQVQSLTAQGTQSVRSDKAFITDLEQRAVSAEQGIRNQQQKINQLTAENNALTQQLDIAGSERDKSLGKEAKNQALFEELQRSNFNTARLNQRLKDLEAEKDAVIESYANELRYLRQQTKAQENRIAQLTDAIRSAPDLVADLKRIAGLS